MTKSPPFKYYPLFIKKSKISELYLVVRFNDFICIT